MKETQSGIQDEELPIYEAVKNLTKDQIEHTVKSNAAQKNFVVKDEHLNVIHVLIEHYKQDCKSDDCMAAHQHMRFLENAFADQGGSKYLYMLFDAVPDSQGVLSPIHELAGLPSLRLQSDKGFGTAF